MVSVEVSVELIDLFICDSSVGKAFAQLVEAEHTCDAVVTAGAPETVTAAANAAVITPAGKQPCSKLSHRQLLDNQYQTTSCGCSSHIWCG